MQAIGSRDTSLELSVRRKLHSLGFRYRVDARPLSALCCKADIVFRRARVAVFLDGCFWHGCEEHFRAPKANAQYWAEKIARNRERDRRNATILEDAGWTVLRFWEHQTVDEIATEIAAVVALRSRGLPQAECDKP